MLLYILFILTLLVNVILKHFVFQYIYFIQIKIEIWMLNQKNICLFTCSLTKEKVITQ